MTLEEAKKYIIDNWSKLEEKGKRFGCTPKMHAIWCANSDTAGSYEVDEEWIGVTPDGKIAWAYASGCSCWDGDFSEERFESMKEVKLAHNQVLPEQWENAIIKFAETGEVQSL